MEKTKKETGREAVDNYIWSIQDKEEINRLWDLLKKRNAQLTEQEANNFNKGQQVAWDDKHGQEHTGTVERVNKKTISIKEDDGIHNWRVSPQFVREA